MILIIISNRAVWSPDDIAEGLTHRYCGLYLNMVKHVVTGGGLALWYDVARHWLFEISLSTKSVLVISSLLKAIMKAIREAFSKNNLVIVLLDYPHSFLEVKQLPEYLIMLLVLHILRFLKRIFVVVDNMDPPIEHAMELNGKVSLLQRILWTLLNNLVFSYDLIVFHSNAYRIYHKLYYNIDYDKTTVIPPGSFPQKIPYIDPPSDPPVRILCSGCITKWISLEKLQEISKKLTDMGLKVKLIIIDKSAPSGAENENIEVVNKHLSYEEFIKMLSNSHVLLLLRPKSLHHLLTVRASLADYIMSGRPLIYLHSLGIREIVKECEAAFEFRSLDELFTIISHVARGVNLLRDLGRKCRSFAVKYLDYRKQALKLLKEILLRYLARLSSRGGRRTKN